MDPQQMAQFIAGTPPVGGPAQIQQPQVQPFAPAAPEPPIFQPGATPMFPAAPAAPMMNQPPAPGGQFPQQTPTWPQFPQVAPGQPVIPGGTIFQQPGQMPQQQQQMQPSGIPLAPPIQFPGQQAQAPEPEWAKTLREQVLAAQNQGAQDGKPWDENNRPKTWEDLYNSMDKMAETKAQKLMQDAAAQQQQKSQQEAQLVQEANVKYDAVENQLAQMGILPPVANPNDPNDPGKAARNELYAYSIAMGATTPEQLGPMAMTLHGLHQAGQYYDKTKNSIVTRNSAAPGAFAPIAGAGPSMAGGPMGAAQQGTGPSVAQLASMNLSSLAQLGAQRLGINQ